MGYEILDPFGNLGCTLLSRAPRKKAGVAGVGAAVVAAASFSPPPRETQGQGNRYEHHSRQQRSTRETVKVRTVRKSVPQRELQVVALSIAIVEAAGRIVLHLFQLL